MTLFLEWCNKVSLELTQTWIIQIFAVDQLLRIWSLYQLICTIEGLHRPITFVIAHDHSYILLNDVKLEHRYSKYYYKWRSLLIHRWTQQCKHCNKNLWMHTPSLQIIPSSYLYKETLLQEFSLHFIYSINLNENDITR